MGVVDIILGALILFGLVRGFIKGLFVEIASLAALISGIYGAIHFSNFTAEFLQSITDWDEKTINIVAFAVTFIVIVLAIALAGKALTKLASFAALGIFNRIAGALFGGAKIALILSVILIIFEKVNNFISFVDEEQVNNSVFYHPVKSLVPTIFPYILDEYDSNPEDNDQKTN